MKACLISIHPFVALDIDEGANRTENCDVDAVCNNTWGSYNYTCKDGIYGDGINCTGNYLFGLISSDLGNRLLYKYIYIYIFFV